MRKITAMLAASVIAVTSGLSAHSAADDNPVAQAIQGKVAEPGTDCVNTQRSHPRLFSHGADLLYRVSNDAVYVVHTSGGCEGVSRGDSLQTRPFKARLCVGDIAYTTQIPSNLPSGSCTIKSVIGYKSKS
jgi:hypothetical protein